MQNNCILTFLIIEGILVFRKTLLSYSKIKGTMKGVFLIVLRENTKRSAGDHYTYKNTITTRMPKCTYKRSLTSDQTHNRSIDVNPQLTSICPHCDCS